MPTSEVKDYAGVSKYQTEPKLLKKCHMVGRTTLVYCIAGIEGHACAQ